jgi:hypothetical protein
MFANRPSQGDALESSLRRRQELVAQQKALKEQIDTIDAALEEYLIATGSTKEVVGPFTVARVTSRRSTLNPHRLVELGVMPDTIKAATSTTEFTYLKVTCAKEG